MARAAGAFFLVDAAQTAGHLPIDVSRSPIDLLAVPVIKACWDRWGPEFSTWRRESTSIFKACDKEGPAPTAKTITSRATPR